MNETRGSRLQPIPRGPVALTLQRHLADAESRHPGSGGLAGRRPHPPRRPPPRRSRLLPSEVAGRGNRCLPAVEGGGPLHGSLLSTCCVHSRERGAGGVARRRLFMLLSTPPPKAEPRRSQEFGKTGDGERSSPNPEKKHHSTKDPCHVCGKYEFENRIMKSNANE